MDSISYNRMKLDMLLRLPLLLSELSVISGLTILVDVKMLAGVFAVALFRLLPALRSILGERTQIQNALFCLEVIEEELKNYQKEKENEKQEFSFELEIKTEGI